MTTSDWVAAIIPTVLLGIGGIVGYFVKTRMEALRALEEKLRSDRRRIYMAVLDPYIRLFANPKAAQEQSQALTKTMTSHEYKKVGFELYFLGSDEVVRAYNEFMQLAYEAEKTGKRDPARLFRRWGKLTRAIRKDLGIKKTKLKEVELLRALIRDIDSVMADAPPED